MPMTLHVAADHGSVEYVHRGEQGRRAVALVVVGHGPGAALFHRQAGLSAIEGLDLALFVDAEHDGVRGGIDIKPDHVAQLVDELGVLRQLELPDPMGLEPMRAPDALDRGDADASCLGHRRARPVRRFAQGRLHSQRDDACGDQRIELRDTRRPRLVAQKPVHTFGGEAFLPAPHAGLGLASFTHDRVRAGSLGAEQNDLRPPDVLLRRVTVSNQIAKPIKVGGHDGKRNARSHAADLHAASPPGIPVGIQMSVFIH